MRKYIAFFSILCFFLSVQVQAKIKFGKYEHIKTVAEMPKTEEFLLNDVALVGDNNQELKIDNKDYIGLGVKYTTFNVAGMPYWVSEEAKLVGTSSLRKDMYYDISPEEADIMLKTAKISKENALKLSFWDKYLGWVVTLVIVIGAIIYYMYFAKEEKEAGTYHDNGDIIEEDPNPRN